MKSFSKTIIAMAFSAPFFSAQADTSTFTAPVFSQCETNTAGSNTENHDVFRLQSEFYYQIEDHREYAIAAVKAWAKKFHSKDSSCVQQQVEISLEDVQCDNSINGAPVCAIESDSGDFIVVKDYVDSTNVVAVAHDNQSWPAISASNDSDDLYMPNPEQCYSDLLGTGGDSQAYYIDAYNYRYFGDYRFVMARTARDLVQNLSKRNASCSYRAQAIAASDMNCNSTSNGVQYCTLSSTNTGYFVFVSDDNHGMHLIFNRWE
ncbi:hypothetical protein SG34_030525 [Thalassomonas viridans]|uniref:Uncharacterized protein n=1 Tax=Thalassomonas viridans TaxID=137584 RepID=A0AAE9ZFR5_9GAMM|nr:hypothetical protein [Thalassomonas viridans]WDE09107.1 hypothetical protein SG34_030525 [Thalassomonas viridans]